MKNYGTERQNEAAGLRCSGCGRVHPVSYNFCPACGTRLASAGNAPVPVNQFVSPAKPEDEITAYLRKRGLLHLADQQYQVFLQAAGSRIIRVPLTGRQNSNDALQYLRSAGILSCNEQYKIPDWPKADPCIGPWSYHVSACVCELPPDRVFHVVQARPEGMAMLYGCPNAKSLLNSTVLDQVRIEVVDYGC